jgi:hypothetical protein
MDHQMMTGPGLGNVIIAVLAGSITIGCFVTMIWMLLRPGEADPQHPKYDILRHDR